jgi:hypothetical protein
MSEVGIIQQGSPADAAFFQLKEPAMHSFVDSFRVGHDEAHLDPLSKPLEDVRPDKSAENDVSKQVGAAIMPCLGASGHLTTKRLFAHTTAKVQCMVGRTHQQVGCPRPAADARANKALCAGGKPPEYGFVEVRPTLSQQHASPLQAHHVLCYTHLCPW